MATGAVSQRCGTILPSAASLLGRKRTLLRSRREFPKRRADCFPSGEAVFNRYGEVIYSAAWIRRGTQRKRS